MAQTGKENKLDRSGVDAITGQLKAEIALMQGDFAGSIAGLKAIEEDHPGFLSAQTVKMASSIALGNHESFYLYWRQLDQLREKQQPDSQTMRLIELTQAMFTVGTHAKSIGPSWLISGRLDGLPVASFPLAMHLRAKRLISLGQIERALGVADTALSLFEADGILAAYLQLTKAHALLYIMDEAQAHQSLDRAIDILLPRGFITPLAESLTTLLGHVERRVMARYPQRLPQILALYEKVAKAWRDGYPVRSRQGDPSLLSRREYQVALTLTTGLSYKQAAHTLGISLGTFKGHQATVYQKLQITQRSELKRLIIPD